VCGENPISGVAPAGVGVLRGGLCRGHWRDRLLLPHLPAGQVNKAHQVIEFFDCPGRREAASGSLSGTTSWAFNQEKYLRRNLPSRVWSGPPQQRHTTSSSVVGPGGASNPTTSYFAAQAGQWNTVAMDIAMHWICDPAGQEEATV
jgi:hypothetical protein